MFCSSFQGLRNKAEEFLTHKASDDVYMLTGSANQIRKKCAWIFISEPFLVIVRVALRALIWIPRACWEGHQKGLRSWENKRVEILMGDKSEELPGIQNLAFRVTAHALYILGKDLFKIALIPFAALYTMLWCIGSLVMPLSARREIGKAEELTAVDVGSLFGWRLFSLVSFSDLIGFVAPCMQPKRVWDEYNLYQIYPDASPETIRSQLLYLQKQLDSMSVYFSPELAQKFKGVVRDLRQDIKIVTFGLRDCKEYGIIVGDTSVKKNIAKNVEQKILERGKKLAELNRLLSSYKKQLPFPEKNNETNQLPDQIEKLFTEISEFRVDRLISR